MSIGIGHISSWAAQIWAWYHATFYDTIESIETTCHHLVATIKNPADTLAQIRVVINPAKDQNDQLRFTCLYSSCSCKSYKSRASFQRLEAHSTLNMPSYSNPVIYAYWLQIGQGQQYPLSSNMSDNSDEICAIQEEVKRNTLSLTLGVQFSLFTTRYTIFPRIMKLKCSEVKFLAKLVLNSKWSEVEHV